MKTLWIFIGVLICLQHASAQEKNTLDSNTTLLESLRSGSMHGQVRLFTSVTDNIEPLTDFWAQGVAFSAVFHSKFWHHFQFSIGGSHVFNLGSSDLSKPDPITQQFNRYEIGLFDVTDPRNRKNMSRLEILNARFEKGKTSIVFGRQSVTTPFINPQDGRMRPTFVEGLVVKHNTQSAYHMQAGWIYALSVRGSQIFESVDRSIGLYPQGVQADGLRSSYHNNIQSKGIFWASAEKKMNDGSIIQIWNQWVENLFNVALIQADMVLKKTEQHPWILSGQFIRQDAIHAGGNLDPAHTYILKGTGANAFGFRLKRNAQHHEFALSYTRITKKGRLLLPREWGRDPFFTFMSRERNEGYGDVHAFRIHWQKNQIKPNLMISWDAGYYKLPDVNHVLLNKYGFPSYAQSNIDIRYKFQKRWEGLEAQLLLVGKKRIGNNYENNRFVLNKVDMILYNFILNYSF